MSRRTLCRSAVALVLSLPGAASHAAPEAPNPVVYTDTVSVQASKTRSRLAELATSATIVPPGALRRGNVFTLTDALAQVPGLHVFDLSGTGSGGAVEGRGFAAQGTTSPMLVLVDGMPINDPESGRVDWNVVGPSEVERLEVLRGPSSYLYGSTTLAGLVNVVTRGSESRPAVWGQASGGSFGGADASAGGAWSAGGRRASLTGRFAHSDGDRDNSASDLASGQATFAAPIVAGWSARAHVLGSDDRRRVPGPVADFRQNAAAHGTLTPDDFRNERSADGSLELQGALSPAWELTATGNGSLHRVEAFETIMPVGGLDRTGDSRGLRGELRARWTPAALEGTSVLAGVEGRAGRLESRYHAAAPDGGALVGAADVARTTGAGYALIRHALGGGWSATAGARIDWTRSRVDDPSDDAPVSANDDQRAMSPTGGIVWAAPGRGSAWVSYAGAFKTPELEQLYDPRPYDLGFGPLHISNHALRAQQDDHWDTGARWRVGPAWVSGSAYYARSRDELGFDLANFRIDNIARSRHAGLEAAVEVAPRSGLGGGASFAWTRATFEGGDFDGHQINTVPELQGTVRLDHSLPAGGSLSLEAEGVAKQWIDESNTLPLPDVALLHVGARVPAGPLECFGGIRNLFDRRYAPMGYVTVDGSGDPLPLYFPGARRAFTLGVRARREL